MLPEIATETIDAEIVDDSIVRETALALIPNNVETPIQAVTRSLATYKAINTLVDQTFKLGVHYGSIPGVDKKILMLPGIESVMGLLGLHERFVDIEVVRQYDPINPFFYYEMECHLFTIGANVEVARGVGVCHSREKIFMRSDQRTCPDCGSPSIMRSKYPPKDKPKEPKGWYCNAKSGGCGANFLHNDTRITEQATGNAFDAQLVWDSVNNIRKKAKKRALADAVKRVGMLSEKFTVDLDDDMTYSDAEMQLTSGDSPTATKTTGATKTNKKTTAIWHAVNDGHNLNQIIVWARNRGMTKELNDKKASDDLLKLAKAVSWDDFESGKLAWSKLTAEHDTKSTSLNNGDANKSQANEATEADTQPEATPPADDEPIVSLSNIDKAALADWIEENFAGRTMASLSQDLDTDWSELSSIGYAKNFLINKATEQCWAVITDMLSYKHEGKSAKYLLFSSVVKEIRCYSRQKLAELLGEGFKDNEAIKALPEKESLILSEKIVLEYEAKSNYKIVTSATPLEAWIPF